MERCQCDSPGFCDFYQTEMLANPPNWQWCQNASPEQRTEQWESIQKRLTRAKKGPSWGCGKNINKRFVTIAAMVEDCKQHLIPKLSKMNISGVLGVPRSGMLPASICALWLNVPIYVVNKEGSLDIMSNVSSFGGSRMERFKEREGSILLIDDTLSTGRAMNNVLSNIKSDENILKCSVYVRPEIKDEVDVYGLALHHPYLLEWCFFNTSHMNISLLDFDGIFSPDVPVDIANDEEKYTEYITNVEPLYHRLPTLFQCKGIVTARLEKYRDITEAWLNKHNVKYGQLHMYPTEKEQARNANHIEEISTFKAEIYSRIPAKIFVESNQREAVLINKKSEKFVVCPDAERVYT